MAVIMQKFFSSFIALGGRTSLLPRLSGFFERQNIIYQNLRWAPFGLLGLIIMPFFAVQAKEVSVEQAAHLQASLNQFISDASNHDGSFTYLNRQSARREMLYPASKHPVILPIGDDFYLCVNMLDADGKKIPVDFLLRLKSGSSSIEYIVIDTFIDQRDLLETALKRN
jgi:hypothetical protein